MATSETPGAFLFGLRLMAVDGTVEDVPDTPANAAAFGRQKGSRGDSAFPQLRNVYLVESGTHAICDAVVRGYRFGERSAALRLLRSVDEGMLLMWDRGFHSFRMVHDCLAQGCHFLGRVPSHAILEPVETLSDGSFIAELYETQYDREKRRNGIRVRVVEYTIDDPSREGHGETHRLITSLMDPRVAPARTLAVEYHQRWEIEITIDEIDTHQRVHNARPLRSEKPTGVIQEMYGMLLAHYIIRFFMHEAALQNRLDPDRISFTNALRIIRRKVDKFQITPSDRRDALYHSMIDEIARQRLAPRDGRCNPRVVKRKMSKFPLKREQHVRPCHPRKAFADSVAVLN
jgi:hypothetical protein